MKTILFSALFSLLSIFQLSAQLTLGEAAYLVGRQQVLAQQITRAYMAVQLKMEAQSYRLLLVDAINIFNANLKKLETFSASESVTKSMGEMEESWDEFYKELTDAPQNEEVLDLVKASYELLKKSDKVLDEIELYAASSPSTAIDMNSLKMLKLAEHQNSLSQHAILYYLAYWNGAKVEDFFSVFHGLISEYETNFAELSEAADELPEIKKQIMANAYEWNETSKIITNMKEAPKKEDLRRVLNSADLLFRDANDIAKSYKKMVDAAVADTDH